MKKMVLATLALIFLLSARIVFAQNTNLSNYQYQLDQYRSNYADYQVLANDYKDHPTLNNEQKAILSAKRTIASRELTSAYYYLTIIDSINASAVDYPLIKQALTDLTAIAQFHFQENQNVGKVVTKTDLTQFTSDYLAAVSKQTDQIVHAQVANKIGELLRLQASINQAVTMLQPRLAANKDDVNVKNGLGQIDSYTQQIKDLIDALSAKTSTISFESTTPDQFYDDANQALMQIRSIQSRLINIIIELDTNYAAH